MKVLLDNNLSPEIARSMNHLLAPDGHLIVAKRDHFGRTDIPDEEWISSLRHDGNWAIITLDDHIRRRRHQREALRLSKITAFFMAPAWQDFPPIQQAGQLMSRWPDIEKAYADSRSGTNLWLPWRSSTRITRLKG